MKIRLATLFGLISLFLTVWATPPEPNSLWAADDPIANLMDCPAEPFKSTKPPDKPYELGDPACDARSWASPNDDIVKKAPTPAPRTAPSVYPNCNVECRHYVGPHTDWPLTGLFAGRYVSNPTGMTTGDTFYNTMHVCSANCARWGEVGWYKFSSGARGVFTYSTDFGFHSFLSSFPISTGQLLHMQLVYDPSNGNWLIWLWWSNQWNLIGAFSIGGTSVRTDVVNEVITDASHFTLPVTQTDGTLLRICGFCSWVAWDTSYPSWTVAGAPYDGHYQNLYYRWYGHLH